MSDINYWIFQGKSDAYDFSSAIRLNLLEEWNVKQHRKTIKNGDKAIIWLTGKNAGCYALADIISDPGQWGISNDHELWNTNDEIGRMHKKEDKDAFKVKIQLTSNLFDKKPVLWDDIKTMKGLENLNVGFRGTNFKAQEGEYKIIKAIVDAKLAG